MKYGFFVFALVLILKAIPASAFEVKNPEADERRLRIELEPVPSQVRQDFDKYVQDLAAAAQRDATPEERARKDDAAKERQAKVVNPMVLFRW
jgi:ribosome recycling factor